MERYNNGCVDRKVPEFRNEECNIKCPFDESKIKQTKPNPGVDFIYDPLPNYFPRLMVVGATRVSAEERNSDHWLGGGDLGHGAKRATDRLIRKERPTTISSDSKEALKTLPYKKHCHQDAKMNMELSYSMSFESDFEPMSVEVTTTSPSTP